MKTDEERLVSLTGVGVLPAGVGGRPGGGAVGGGGGGGRRLVVRSLAQRVSSAPAGGGGGRVALLGDGEARLGELLGRALLVQLHGFTHCTQTRGRRRKLTLALTASTNECLFDDTNRVKGSFSPNLRWNRLC